jgi:acetyl-CoA carboxylase carboxyl transferase beta subunit/acetyl-CoA carboxylase carboxyl transferase alpha subunit
MQPLTARPATEDTEWVKCPACDAMVYGKRLRRNLGVCPECNHHFRLTAADRLAQLLDVGSFEELSGDVEPVDVLGFVDAKPYPQRLEEARGKTGSREAAVYGTGSIGGMPLVVAAMEFGFMGGSMGAAVGEIVTRAAELALETATPLLLISASGGARMQEGCISLMQMAKTSQAIARLHDAGLLCICLNTDPTFGGTTASFAMLGDVLIAEPGSLIGFAGPQVIQQTIRQRLPERFQTAEFLLEHGMLDLVEPRESMRNTIGRILSLHCRHPRGQLPAWRGSPPVTDPQAIHPEPVWELVSLARNPERPTTLDYIVRVFDDFQELHGDRVQGDSSAIVGGLARLGGRSIMVLGHQKGHTTGEMISRNFGMPQPDGYRKALRLLRYAAKFGLPVVTLVDTPGAYPGIEAERDGQGMAIARCIMELSRLPVPVVTVVTGEGGSGGALALAVADRVLLLEHAYYSVISPEGCSTILWRTAAAAPAAAEALRLTPRDLLRLGVIDAVVPEPEGGAQHDWVQASVNLQTALVSSLEELLPVSPDELVDTRYVRYRSFGRPGVQPTLPREPS